MRRRGLVALATLTLAVGLGGNVTIFSFFNGVYLRPLPYDDPERLLSIAGVQAETGRRAGLTAPDVDALRAQSRSLDLVATQRSEVLALTGAERPQRVVAVHLTPGALATLGATTVDGRLFRADEAQPGSAPVVVLSHPLWSTHFGGADVIGASIALDGTPHTVVGVLEPDFSLLRKRPDLYIAERELALYDPQRRSFGVFARLAAGATLEQARGDLRSVDRELAVIDPTRREGWRLEAEPLAAAVRPSRDVRRTMPVVFAAVGLVLLVACANVAGLLMARAAARRQELTVRAALGAGRARLTFGIVAESLLLALLGGVVALVLAQAGVRALLAAAPIGEQTLFHFALDHRLLLFTLAACIVTALLAAWLPSVQVLGTDLASALRGTGAAAHDGRGRWGQVLIVGEIMLAFVLLAAASVVIRGLGAMHDRDLGFDPESILTLRLDPPSGRYPDIEDLERFYDALAARLGALPGVVAVGMTNDLTLTGSDTVGPVTLPGRAPSAGEPTRTSLRSVSPDYFRTLTAPMVAGRGLGAQDHADGPPVAVVNEAWARRWSDAEPGDGDVADVLGRQLIAWDDAPRQIVGVVRDLYEVRLDRPLEPVVYLPAAQVPVRDRSLLVRVEGRPEDYAGSVQRAVWELDPDLPISMLQTLPDVVSRQAWVFRLLTSLLSLFALATWSLTAVGIYGVTSNAVSRRTAEIGVRMALGSTRRGVLRLLLREALGRSLLGIALGLPLAVLGTRALAGVLYGVDAAGFFVLFATTALVLATTSLACLVPARRAASVDPVLALRQG